MENMDRKISNIIEQLRITSSMSDETCAGMVKQCLPELLEIRANIEEKLGNCAERDAQFHRENARQARAE